MSGEDASRITAFVNVKVKVNANVYQQSRMSYSYAHPPKSTSAIRPLPTPAPHPDLSFPSKLYPIGVNYCKVHDTRRRDKSWRFGVVVSPPSCLPNYPIESCRALAKDNHSRHSRWIASLYTPSVSSLKTAVKQAPTRAAPSRSSSSTSSSTSTSTMPLCTETRSEKTSSQNSTTAMSTLPT